MNRRELKVGEDVILVISKNRPYTLSRTMESLRHTGVQIAVIDASSSEDKRSLVRDVVQKTPSAIYQGRSEQSRLVKDLGTSGTQLFVRPLGSPKWDTGYVRNYALILCSALRSERVLFVDDDIVMRDPRLYSEMNERLRSHDFVGAKATGLIDDSEVGHIQRAMGDTFPSYVSAGFLAFRLKSVVHSFLNCYNEDWIWLYLHSRTAKVLRCGSVYHIPTPSQMGPVREALSQELGELLVTGLQEAVKVENPEVWLTDELNWKSTLITRTKEVEDVLTRSKQLGYDGGVTVALALLHRLEGTSPKYLASLFKRYFSQEGVWMEVLEKARETGYGPQ